MTAADPESHLTWEPRPGGWRTRAGTFVGYIIPLWSGKYSWVALDRLDVRIHGRGRSHSLRAAMAGVDGIYRMALEARI